MSKKKRRLWPDVTEPYGFDLIDNHTHLPLTDHDVARDSDGVALPLGEQLRRALRVGVRAVISSACDLDAVAGARAYLEGYAPRDDEAEVYWALGLHPNEAAVHAGYRERSPDGLTPDVTERHAAGLDEALAIAERAIRSHPERVVAVGETGLDYFRTGPAGHEAQRAAFAAQIALAKDLDLPMQIHDRDAHDDVVRTLLQHGAPERTVFHCFSGGRQLAEICNERGWFVSVAGPITYPANDELRAAIAAVDESLLLIETDAPYLTPAPWRGAPNASYAIGATMLRLAEVRGVAPDVLAQRIYTTTRGVYAI